MTGYTKLFGSIVASTIWREDDKTRLVWITMLAIANKHGEVEASVPGLADLSRVSVAECRASLAKLEAPDPDSRSSEQEGRRIEKMDGGWRLINHAKYRAKLSVDERREYLAQKQREHRARQQPSTNVNKCQQPSTSSTHTEADTNPDAKAEAKAPAKEKAEPKAKRKPPAVAAQSDEDWLRGLQTVLAYEHLNVAAEYSRAKVWCETNRRQCTRRFFAAWLNRSSADRPMTTSPAPQSPAPRVPKESEQDRFHRVNYTERVAAGLAPTNDNFTDTMRTT